MSDAMQMIQRKLDTRLLSRGRVVIIGLGGVGSILVQNLIVFLAALAGEIKIRLLLCDGDAFNQSNAYRVDIPEFANKAAAWCGELCRRFPVPGLSIRAIPKYLSADNQHEIIQEGDVCFLCCDNHATRKLASDRVKSLKNAVLISGGNDGVNETQNGTYGNVQVYVREKGRDCHGVPLEAFHPEIADPEDRNPDELDCLEMAVAGEPQLGFANMAVALYQCTALLRLMMPPPGERMYDEVCFDLLAAEASPLWISGPQFEPKPRKTKRPRRKLGKIPR